MAFVVLHCDMKHFVVFVFWNVQCICDRRLVTIFSQFVAFRTAYEKVKSIDLLAIASNKNGLISYALSADILMASISVNIKE